MRDEMHRNFGTMTGTPVLVAGALPNDADQALSFNGTTNSMSVADSASDSLAVADGAAGGMALECWVRLAAIPGSTKDIIAKSGSFALQVNSAGKLLWTLTNGANNVTVTSASTLSTNTWYHVVGVYNGDYTGATIFGNQTQGSAQLSVPGDYYQGSPTGLSNLQVCRYTALEKGSLNSIVIDLHRVHDATLNEQIRAVAFGANTSTTPGAKIGESAIITLNNTIVPSRTWLVCPITGAFVAGDVWLGLQAGESSAQFEIGYEATGGNRALKSDLIADGAGTPFGTPASTDAKQLAVYANYTQTGRTGAEGRALLYLNGKQDAFSAYAHGIADSANAILFASSVAVQIDDVSIWNVKLTPVQVAAHFNAR